MFARCRRKLLRENNHYHSMLRICNFVGNFFFVMSVYIAAINNDRPPIIGRFNYSFQPNHYLFPAIFIIKPINSSNNTQKVRNSTWRVDSNNVMMLYTITNSPLYWHLRKYCCTCRLCIKMTVSDNFLNIVNFKSSIQFVQPVFFL